MDQGDGAKPQLSDLRRQVGALERKLESYDALRGKVGALEWKLTLYHGWLETTLDREWRSHLKSQRDFTEAVVTVFGWVVANEIASQWLHLHGLMFDFVGFGIGGGVMLSAGMWARYCRKSDAKKSYPLPQWEGMRR